MTIGLLRVGRTTVNNSFRRLLRRFFDETLGKEMDKRIEVMFNREIDRRIDHRRLNGAMIFGRSDRLSVASSAIVNNALFNTISGRITVCEYAFFGHNVCLLTGTHDVASLGAHRQQAIPDSGRDIVIATGAWVASNAVVLGPCTIGEHAVVAAGAVVSADVPAFAIVGGVPAHVIGYVPRPKRTVTAETDQYGLNKDEP